MPQLANDVALVTWTDADAPEAMSPKLHVSVFDEMPQAALAGTIDQLMPAPVGSGSLSVTDVATPGPALCTLIVNPMFCPLLTDDASAVFVIERFGHCTVVDAELWCELLSFTAVTIAVFVYVAQLANAVALVMCTCVDAPDARSPNEQFNVCDGAVPAIEQVPGPL